MSLTKADKLTFIWRETKAFVTSPAVFMIVLFLLLLVLFVIDKTKTNLRKGQLNIGMEDRRMQGLI